MAIVATGGYGRALLAPGSDIDLLFLLPYKKTAWGESVAEYMLYMLWDLGFKVGHATRTVDQCVKMSADITVRTALLDARLIHGDGQLYGEFEERFRTEVVHGTARAFIDAKMAEHDARHRTRRREPLQGRAQRQGRQGRPARSAHAALAVEIPLRPGRRRGDGRRRHLHARRRSRPSGAAKTSCGPSAAFCTSSAAAPEEVLTFDVQPWLAAQLGYNDRGGLLAVERFMKHYFLVAKDVGDLTTILCSALEMQQLKSSPGLSRLLRPLNWKQRRQLRTRTDFRIDNDRLNVADADVFKRDPVNLIRFFAEARPYQLVPASRRHPAAAPIAAADRR